MPAGAFKLSAGATQRRAHAKEHAAGPAAHVAAGALADPDSMLTSQAPAALESGEPEAATLTMPQPWDAPRKVAAAAGKLEMMSWYTFTFDGPMLYEYAYFEYLAAEEEGRQSAGALSGTRNLEQRRTRT
jgi:hypothetical protein